MRMFSALVVFIGICLWGQSVHGQNFLERGAGAPNPSIQSSWYFDTVDHRVWKRHGSNWVSSKLGYTVDIVVCGQLIAFFNGDEWKVYSGRSCKYVDFGENVECLPGLTRVQWTSINRFYTDSTLVGWSWVKGYGGTSSKDPLAPDTLNGVAAYCASNYVGNKTMVDQFSEAHAWGMLGVDGKWWIEPKYDKHFRFKNGFAEVMLYGEKLRINTLGEVVK